jgi:hypothetical protein
MAATEGLSLREVSRYTRGVLTQIFGTRSYLGHLRELNFVQPSIWSLEEIRILSNMRDSTLSISILT